MLGFGKMNATATRPWLLPEVFISSVIRKNLDCLCGYPC